MTAPGVSESGVTDPMKLRNAHAMALGRISYTVTEVYEARYANGTLRSRTEVVGRIDENRTRYHVTTELDGEKLVVYGGNHVRMEWFADGERAFRRTTSNGSVVVENEMIGPDGRPIPPREAFVFDSTSGTELYRTFAAVNATDVEAVTRDGTRLVRIRGSEIEHPDLLVRDERVSNPSNLSFTAFVGQSGIVRDLRLSYDATLNGTPIEMSWTLRYERLGATAVHRPAWVDHAAENESRPETENRSEGETATSTADATATENAGGTTATNENAASTAAAVRSPG